MTLGNAVRLVVVLIAVGAAIGSASSSSPNQNGSMIAGYGQAQGSAPPPQEMEPARALGLWRSTFGAVKIEADNSRGGLQSGAVQGVWVYQRQGQEVVGYFNGSLRGNVLQFTWQEPNNPPLIGEGYLVFDQQGRQYSGRWWSERRDRVGDWNGWRNAGQENATRPDSYRSQQPNGYGQPGPYQPNGGQNRDPYGGQPNGDPYGGQPYGGSVPTYAPRPPQPGPQPQPPQNGPQPYGPQPTPPTYY